MTEIDPDSTDSCPWCLAPASEFERRDNGTLGCGRCAAVLPEGESWYLEGDKIVSIRDAANRFRYDRNHD